MKILFFCGIYTRGHDFFNEKTIENLSKVGDLYVIEPDKWFSRRDENAFYYDCGIKTPSWRFSHLSLFFTSVRNYLKAIKIARKEKVDVIVAGEYELISIWLFRLFCRRQTFLIQHNNLDQIDRRGLFRFIFKRIKNKFNHIVLEDFIVQHMVEDLCVNERLVSCWRHPVASSQYRKFNSLDCEEEKQFDCVGLSRSNDESFIKELYECELNNHYLETNGEKVVIKSSEVSCELENLRIIKGFVEQDVYDSLVYNSVSSLTCYPTTYRFRVSAVIAESIWRGQIVIGTEIPLLKYYKGKYPSLFYLCTAHSFASVLMQIKDSNKTAIKEEIFQFIEDHSDNTITKQMVHSLLPDNDEK